MFVDIDEVHAMGLQYILVSQGVLGRYLRASNVWGGNCSAKHCQHSLGGCFACCLRHVGLCSHVPEREFSSIGVGGFVKTLSKVSNDEIDGECGIGNGGAGLSRRFSRSMALFGATGVTSPAQYLGQDEENKQVNKQVLTVLDWK